jgi:hypothetical protein
MTGLKKQLVALLRTTLYSVVQTPSRSPTPNFRVEDIVMVRAETSESKPTVATTSEVKELRYRRVYLDIRLPNLRQEIKAIGEEKNTLTEKLRNTDALAQEEKKKLLRRRIYVVHHHKALMAESKVLSEERKELLEKLRGMSPLSPLSTSPLTNATPS